MLQVYHSNRLELLFEILCAQRAENKLLDPFQADEILVANPGIGRWLSLELSNREGIAANIDYPLPASFIWRLYRQHLSQVPEHSAFNKPRLQWELLQLLQKLPQQDAFQPLHSYMQTDNTELSAVKRVQLAAKIADVYDQYLVYRPDWLLAWEQGERPSSAPGDWQAALWCELRAKIDEPHRATLHRAFCEAAANGQLIKSQLPNRLFIFNVVSIPPSYLDVLTALAQHVPVDLYLLNPSVEFWDEITDRKRQLKLRQKQGGDTPLDDGNPLLAATGRLGQNALRLLHQRGEFVHEENFSLPSDKYGRLAQLQCDVLTLTQPAQQDQTQLGLIVEEDHSLEVHSVHSVLREVQVLHDQLLARFERLQELTPADVIVMVPNVDKYAPAITAVFGSAPSERYIPWEIADQSLGATDPVVGLVRGMLDLGQSQFQASEVLAWLAQPVLARRFDLHRDEHQSLLAGWVEDSNARRLLGTSPLVTDAAAPLNSWAFALRRLLLGYMVAEPEQPTAGVYACRAIEGGDAEVLGRLIDCLEHMGAWRSELTRALPMQSWLQCFNRMVEDLFDPDEAEAAAIQQLRGCLSALADNAELASYDDPMEPAAMLAMLDNDLSGSQGKTQRFLTGRVTISSMVPLRSVPFRVVCLLGLNDGEFPRQNNPVSFDLIHANPRIGDRSMREDDHYLFLEALLSARDELYLSWIGRNSIDNQEQTPSILLAELLDYFRHDETGLKVVQHPLQAFSTRCFDPSDPQLCSYAAQWLGGDRPERPEHQPEMPAAGSLPLSRFLSFWRSPVDYYCREVLRVNLSNTSQLAADAEPFSLDALQGYQLRNNLLEGALGETPVDGERAFAATVGRGELPHGAFAERFFTHLQDDVQDLVERVAYFSQGRLAPTSVSLMVHGWQIEGELLDLHESATGVRLLMVRPGSFNASDRTRLVLSHFIGCAAGLINTDSVFVTREKNHKIAHLAAADALELLQPWLDLYARGYTEALQYFPNSSWAYVEGRGKLEEKWQGGDYSSGEGLKESTQLLWPDLEDPLTLPDFTGLAEQLLLPLQELLEEEKK